MPYTFTIHEAEPQPAMSMRGTTTRAQIANTIGAFMGEVWQHLEASGAQIAGRPFTRYHGFNGEEIDLEAGFPVAAVASGSDRVRASSLPGGEVVSTVHRGPYERLPDAGAALGEWLREHDRTAAGPMWELYVTNPGDVTDPADYETIVSVPLQPRG